VNESLCVGGSQAGRGLHSDSQNLDEREWPIVIESALQARVSGVESIKCTFFIVYTQAQPVSDIRVHLLLEYGQLPSEHARRCVFAQCPLQ